MGCTVIVERRTVADKDNAIMFSRQLCLSDNKELMRTSFADLTHRLYLTIANESDPLSPVIYSSPAQASRFLKTRGHDSVFTRLFSADGDTAKEEETVRCFYSDAGGILLAPSSTQQLSPESRSRMDLEAQKKERKKKGELPYLLLLPSPN